MKIKISKLTIGDTVEIKGKQYDVYDTPTRLENGTYLFPLVGYGEIDRVRRYYYITPADLIYELSSNFENEEVEVMEFGNVKKVSIVPEPVSISELEDRWEDEMSSYRPFYGW